jgi:predicted SprT family Zn-dependent metalloprotease
VIPITFPLPKQWPCQKCFVRHIFSVSKREHIRDYITLSDCYDELNRSLFKNRLPGCVLTFEDKGQRFGHYRFKGYVARDGKEKRDEICLNPRHFLTNTGDLELMQTLTHEMCHQWQYHHGKNSRAGYHNKEWGGQMESIGLIPSDTGEPGGKKTGQTMADYPAKDGIFLKVATKILEGKELIRYYKNEVFLRKLMEGDTSPEEESAWQEAAEAYAEEEGTASGATSKPKPPSKLKYSCPKCKANVWGKPDLEILCGKCSKPQKPIAFEIAD